MLKKLLVGCLTLLFALTLVGCGGGNDKSADKPADKTAASTEKKADANTPAVSADKAVLAYAELAALGMSDNSAATGLLKNQLNEVVAQWDKNVFGMFNSMFPLSDDSLTELNAEFYAHLSTEMEIQTKIKKDDKEHPVVELTAKSLSLAAVENFTANNENVQGILLGLKELRESGMTDEQLKANKELQAKLVELLKEYINSFPVNEKKSIDITCEMVKGDDGKMYWAPKDVNEVVNFVIGK